MFVYNLIFILLFIFLLLNQLIKYKIFENILLIIVFITFVLLAGLRYNISSDYFEYKNTFQFINENGTFTQYFIEPGYIYLNKLVGYFTDNFNILLLVIALLSIGCKFYFINSLSQDRLLSSLLLFSFYLLLYDLGAIRRGLALGICSIAIIFYIKDKIRNTIICILFAALFHSSVLIFLPFLFFKKVKIYLFLFIFIIFLSYILQYILNNVAYFQFLSQSNNPILIKAYGYFESGDYFVENNTLSFGFFIRIILIFFLIINKNVNYLIHNYKHEKLLFLYIISMSILIIFDKLHIFSSVAIYFKFVEIILIPYFIYSLNKFQKIFSYTLLIIYLYLSLYKLINNPIEKDFYPYQSILNEALY